MNACQVADRVNRASRGHVHGGYSRAIDPTTTFAVLRGRYPMLMAILERDPTAFRQQLAGHPKSAEERDAKGLGPLQIAAYCGEASMVEALLKAGLDPQPALAAPGALSLALHGRHLAPSKAEHVKTVELLLASDFYQHPDQRPGFVCLYVALFNGAPYLLRPLMEAGVYLTRSDTKRLLEEVDGSQMRALAEALQPFPSQWDAYAVWSCVKNTVELRRFFSAGLQPETALSAVLRAALAKNDKETLARMRSNGVPGRLLPMAALSSLQTIGCAKQLDAWAPNCLLSIWGGLLRRTLARKDSGKWLLASWLLLPTHRPEACTQKLMTECLGSVLADIMTQPAPLTSYMNVQLATVQLATALPVATRLIALGADVDAHVRVAGGLKAPLHLCRAGSKADPIVLLLLERSSATSLATAPLFGSAHTSIALCCAQSRAGLPFEVCRKYVAAALAKLATRPEEVVAGLMQLRTGVGVPSAKKAVRGWLRMLWQTMISSAVFRRPDVFALVRRWAYQIHGKATGLYWIHATGKQLFPGSNACSRHVAIHILRFVGAQPFAGDPELAAAPPLDGVGGARPGTSFVSSPIGQLVYPDAIIASAPRPYVPWTCAAFVRWALRMGVRVRDVDVPTRRGPAPLMKWAAQGEKNGADSTVLCQLQRASLPPSCPSLYRCRDQTQALTRCGRTEKAHVRCYWWLRKRRAKVVPELRSMLEMRAFALAAELVQKPMAGAVLTRDVLSSIEHRLVTICCESGWTAPAQWLATVLMAIGKGLRDGPAEAAAMKKARRAEGGGADR
jgi:hypothetical protein